MQDQSLKTGFLSLDEINFLDVKIMCLIPKTVDVKNFYFLTKPPQSFQFWSDKFDFNNNPKTNRGQADLKAPDSQQLASR